MRHGARARGLHSEVKWRSPRSANRAPMRTSVDAPASSDGSDGAGGEVPALVCPRVALRVRETIPGRLSGRGRAPIGGELQRLHARPPGNPLIMPRFRAPSEILFAEWKCVERVGTAPHTAESPTSVRMYRVGLDPGRHEGSSSASARAARSSPTGPRSAGRSSGPSTTPSARGGGRMAPGIAGCTAKARYQSTSR